MTDLLLGISNIAADIMIFQKNKKKFSFYQVEYNLYIFLTNNNRVSNYKFFDKRPVSGPGSRYPSPVARVPAAGTGAVEYCICIGSRQPGREPHGSDPGSR